MDAMIALLGCFLGKPQHKHTLQSKTFWNGLGVLLKLITLKELEAMLCLLKAEKSLEIFSGT
jgi:hypothetical protein